MKEYPSSYTVTGTMLPEEKASADDAGCWCCTVPAISGWKNSLLGWIRGLVIDVQRHKVVEADAETKQSAQTYFERL